jgi:hypothetical protein
MKIRNGFVSNSSSSSFVLDKEGLTKEQIEKLNDYFNQVQDLEDSDNEIYESNKHWYGLIDINNEPSLSKVIVELGIDPEKVDN